MTKRKKMVPARKSRDGSRDDDSLLLRSAESLGRVIGALQRQLDVATKRLSDTAGDAFDQLPSIREIADGVANRVTASATSTKRRTSPRAAKKTTGRKPTGATKGSRKQAPSRKRTSSKKTGHR